MFRFPNTAYASLTGIKFLSSVYLRVEILQKISYEHSSYSTSNSLLTVISSFDIMLAELLTVVLNFR
jgi:hypothetical protein